MRAVAADVADRRVIHLVHVGYRYVARRRAAPYDVGDRSVVMEHLAVGAVGQFSADICGKVGMVVDDAGVEHRGVDRVGTGRGRLPHLGGLYPLRPPLRGPSWVIGLCQRLSHIILRDAYDLGGVFQRAYQLVRRLFLRREEGDAPTAARREFREAFQRGGAYTLSKRRRLRGRALFRRGAHNGACRVGVAQQHDDLILRVVGGAGRRTEEEDRQR
ncbi:hypothetical protein SDC9_84735 [bioreactor metagenome]|uniref:Uncharacterized protein n=1 Tax=bioreactor metagenome TaxID=1076179 RepID=A0A644ZCT5_9ZZZZ